MKANRPLYALSLALLVAACDDAPPPPPPAAPPQIPGAGAAEEPTAEPEEGPEVAYAYSPIGKRDPFRSFFDDFVKEEASNETTELQRFEVDQLRLTGVVTGRATPYAMVEDPNKKGHTLTRGTLIGKNWGRVASIEDRGCVVIKEEYRDYTGRKVTNTIEMCLPKAEDLKLD